MALHTLDNDTIRVSIDEVGAELSSLRDAQGRELLWQGRSVWKRRAPILFPIIGQMPGGLMRHDGVDYPIGQHGFARDQCFELTSREQTELVFTLLSTEETRSHFPFLFRIDVRYSIEGTTLRVATTVTNEDFAPFSASLGEHPAFAWPLEAGIARNTHSIVFEREEPARVRRLADGLVIPETFETPVVDRTLSLRASLFRNDAIIFDDLVSRSVRYSAPGAPAIVVRFDDFPILGVWSKIPGKFVCIEPWFGMTAPTGFAGEYDEKPHQFRLDPGVNRVFSYSVTIEEPEL